MIMQHIERIPFDLKQYHVISYEQTIEGAQILRGNLLKEINNIDFWKRKPSNPVQEFGTSIPKVDFRMTDFNNRLTALEALIKNEGITKFQQESVENFETIFKRLDNLEDIVFSVAKESKKTKEAIIGSKAEIAGLPSRLVEAVNERRVLLFTGAGISASAGIPTANELLSIIQEKASLPDVTDFANTMSIAEAKIGRHELVSTVLTALRKDTHPPSKVHLLIANIPFDIIVTTNFDILLEKAFIFARRKYFTVVSPEDLVYADTSDILLIKIHGSIDRPDSLILTSSEYQDFETHKSLLVQTLTNYFITRTVLFVGHSLRDESILRIIQDIGAKLGAHKRPVYFVGLSDDKVVVDRMKEIWPIIFIEEKAESFFEKLSMATTQKS